MVHFFNVLPLRRKKPLKGPVRSWLFIAARMLVIVGTHLFHWCFTSINLTLLGLKRAVCSSTIWIVFIGKLRGIKRSMARCYMIIINVNSVTDYFPTDTHSRVLIITSWKSDLINVTISEYNKMSSFVISDNYDVFWTQRYPTSCTAPYLCINMQISVQIFHLMIYDF